MKIYIAGHRGLVGSALVQEIDAAGTHQWIGKDRFDLDLLNRAAVFDYLATEKPDAVIIAAAKVGGIMANSLCPVEFLSQNLQIETNLIDGAHAANINRLVFLGSSCIYPKMCPQPIKEEYLLTGALEETNASYAISKIAGIKLIQAYRKQYDREWISVMPTNLYGPRDNFDLETSHVVPGLMHKFHLAKTTNATFLTLWGTGKPRREFLHVADLAKALIFLLENYDDQRPINIGTGSDISIKSLALLMCNLTGFKGEVHWDSSKPDGTPQKILDVSRINDLGWMSTITLEEGLKATYDWFLKEK